MNGKPLISAANAQACELFSRAQEALRAQDFAAAAELMREYRRSVRYDEFVRRDARLCAEAALSVIIVAYATNADLVECVTSVLAGGREDVEIIVVDNGGNEQALGPLLRLPLLYIACPMNLGPSEGRNIGVRYARAPVCAFLDDDALVPPDYAQNALAPFASADILAVRGRVIPKTPTAFQGDAPHYDPGPEPLPHPVDVEGNSVWRKDAYVRADGMDPLLFGHEGADLSRRLTAMAGRTATFYRPSLVIRHDYAEAPAKKAAKERRHALMDKYAAWKIICEAVLPPEQGRPPEVAPERREGIRKAYGKQPVSACVYVTALTPGGRGFVDLARDLAARGCAVRVLGNTLEGACGRHLSLLEAAGLSITGIGDDEHLRLGIAWARQNPHAAYPLRRLSDEQRAALCLVGALRRLAPDILYCHQGDAAAVGGCAGLCAGVPRIVCVIRAAERADASAPERLDGWPLAACRWLARQPKVFFEADSRENAFGCARRLGIEPDRIGIASALSR
jgi:hypothetical protein